MCNFFKIRVMKKNLFKALTLIAFVALTVACSKLPQAEIDAANLAVQEAKAVEADVYVPEQFAALQDSVNQSLEMVETQKSKFFKNYKAVTAKLVRDAELAAQVKTAAVAKKEEVKAQIVVVSEELAALLVSNKELLTKAPKGKEGKAALEAINSELAMIEGAQAEIDALSAEGKLMDALNKANAAKEKAQAINAELTEVIEKYTKKR